MGFIPADRERQLIAVFDLFFLSRFACRFSASVFRGCFLVSFLESCDLDILAVSFIRETNTDNVSC